MRISGEEVCWTGESDEISYEMTRRLVVQSEHRNNPNVSYTLEYIYRLYYRDLYLMDAAGSDGFKNLKRLVAQHKKFVNENKDIL